MKKLLILALAWLSPSVPASAQNVGVVSSADPRATEAGMEILRGGGSASDAAMAMMLALTVVEPQSSGIGGGGFLLYDDGKAEKPFTINGRETAPATAKPDRFIDSEGKPLGFRTAVLGGRSVGVPGNIDLMAKAHRKWGKAKWSAIFAPAIRLAEGGFVVNKTLETRLGQFQSAMSQFPEAQKIYWVDGAPAKAGTIIRNPELAKTLHLLAKRGPKAFYSGPVARNIVTAVQKSPVSPGDMTLGDLAKYKAKEQNAVCKPYRIYVVCGMGPPSSGATTILQMLGMLERFDLGAMGKDNARSWHLISEAMRLAYADREKYLGDPDFVEVPVEAMLDRGYLAERSKLIDPERAATSYNAGTPANAKARTPGMSGEVAGTTHFVAIDGKGRMASMTSTIEGPFGSNQIAGGFFLNNELTDFTFTPERDGALVANRVQAGKRPLSSMSPTIVYDQSGKPVIALGSAGGKRIIMHVAKTIIGRLDFGLPLADAIALPNLYFTENEIMIEKSRVSALFVEQLAMLGKPVIDLDFPSKVNGAELTAMGWVGAADPRSEGTARAE